MPAVNYKLLSQKRDELDLSNGELAELVNTTSKYVSNIVRGADAPSMRVVHRFSRALGLSVEEILDVQAKPTGDPSDPPTQPAGGPKSPPSRRDSEKTTSPKRPDSALPVAS